MKKATFAMVILFIFTGTFSPFNAIYGADGPVDRVRRMLDEVMSIQGDPKLQGQDFREHRRVKIRGIIAKNLHTGAMAEKALGQHWEALNEAQRNEFKKIFEDIFQDSYTRLVLDFLGQEKIIYKREEIRQERAEVPTIIMRMNEEIPVDYALVTVGKEWLVDDVRIDGVSIVENYRRSFARVIKGESYNALVEKMRLQRKAIEKSL